MVQPDPLGLGLYGSDDEGKELSSDTSESEASDSSLSSAEVRAAEAAEKVKDYDTATTSKKAALLPSALDAFEEVDDQPDFLNPEATRPIPVSSTHGLLAASGGGAGAGRGKPGARHGPKGRVPEGQAFDIAKLAPPMKGQGGEKRGPAGAVIEGKAKRYKQEEGPEATQQYTAAQIAMMGGNVPVSEALGEEGPAGGEKKAAGPSKAMGVSDFLDKGVGGALLPRKQQDRKDKEKKKRALGQSAIGSWKTEAEMVLRQQYDS